MKRPFRCVYAFFARLVRWINLKKVHTNCGKYSVTDCNWSKSYQILLQIKYLIFKTTCKCQNTLILVWFTLCREFIYARSIKTLSHTLPAIYPYISLNFFYVRLPKAFYYFTNHQRGADARLRKKRGSHCLLLLILFSFFSILFKRLSLIIDWIKEIHTRYNKIMRENKKREKNRNNDDMQTEKVLWNVCHSFMHSSIHIHIDKCMERNTHTTTSKSTAEDSFVRMPLLAPR